MNFGVRTVRKSEECAKTHLRAPGSQKKFQGLCPLEGRKSRKERGGEGKIGPPNFETVVAPLREAASRSPSALADNTVVV